MTANTLVTKLTPRDFVERMSMYHGQEQVTITVGESDLKKSYKLPKDLVCYQSKIFNAAFNGYFSEASTLTYSLPDHSPKIFEMVLQFMHLGTVSTGAGVNISLTIEERRDKIAQGVKFFVLADEIDLLGPYDVVLTEIRDILRADSIAALVPPHIQEAFTKLPQGNPLRQLFADACVRSWLLKTQPDCRGRFGWRFEEELELESFASDLLNAVGRARKQNKVVVNNTVNSSLHKTTEPISGTDFMYY